MHSLPTESQDLKKLDLRHMCDTVVKELEVVEKEAAYDYIKVSTELEELGEELILADGIMGELEDVLFDFKSHLESIKNEMTTLQEKSNRMNTSLNNRKKLQNLLNTFIDSAVLDKDLIEAICLGEINEDYVVHIKGLLKKLSTYFFI
jgi:predicted  nucleic acid-binding Zn-ribbon protein